MPHTWPKVSIITPVLNAASVLPAYFSHLKKIHYEGEIELVMPDGGSTDKTLELAKQYGATVVPNAKKTGESGKAVGLRRATGEIIVLLDSDNFVPTSDWLTKLITPLIENPEFIGAEPLSYTWRREDAPLTRYFALLGMGDPLAYFTGNYDRFSVLSNTWTGLPVKEKEAGNWLDVTLERGKLPTIGANGTAFRADFLKPFAERDYLFDIDIVAEAVEKKPRHFAKVKIGIVHLYVTTLKQFARKQRRRIDDFFFHQQAGRRAYKWENRGHGQLFFVLSCLLVFPLLWQMIIGMSRKFDWAWLYHLPVCYITLWVYGSGRIRAIFHTAEADRSEWKQG